MIMIVLEGHVEQEQWPNLVAAYEAANKDGPRQLLEMFLVQDITDRTLWRAVTIWPSREALLEFRQSAGTPRGETIFRSVGAEPVHYVLDVALHWSAGAA